VKHWSPDPFSGLGSREQVKPKRLFFGRRWSFDPREVGMVILAGALLGIGFDVVSDGLSRWQTRSAPVLSRKEAAALLARRNRERLGGNIMPNAEDPPSIYDPPEPEPEAVDADEAGATAPARVEFDEQPQDEAAEAISNGM
jgi:hypothetical protein